MNIRIFSIVFLYFIGQGASACGYKYGTGPKIGEYELMPTGIFKKVGEKWQGWKFDVSDDKCSTISPPNQCLAAGEKTEFKTNNYSAKVSFRNDGSITRYTVEYDFKDKSKNRTDRYWTRLGTRGSCELQIEKSVSSGSGASADT